MKKRDGKFLSVTVKVQRGSGGAAPRKFQVHRGQRFDKGVTMKVQRGSGGATSRKLKVHRGQGFDELRDGEGTWGFAAHPQKREGT